MGFGTLFFGYFLLLNITYYTFTDLISALISALGLYRLSAVNRQFKSGFYISLVFAGIGLAELVFQFIAMFDTAYDISAALSYTAAPRYVAVAALTLLILTGIENVADEVGLSELAKRARISAPVNLILYCLLAILEIPGLEALINTAVLYYASVILLVLSLVATAINLVTVYRAYMKICMPDDVDNSIEEKPSRFSFVNRHREHTREKQREYTEYKLNKLKKKNSKKKK